MMALFGTIAESLSNEIDVPPSSARIAKRGLLQGWNYGTWIAASLGCGNLAWTSLGEDSVPATSVFSGINIDCPGGWLGAAEG